MNADAIGKVLKIEMEPPGGGIDEEAVAAERREFPASAAPATDENCVVAPASHRSLPRRRWTQTKGPGGLDLGPHKGATTRVASQGGTNEP